MAFVVTVAQQKGGAGKSTVAANLAAALAGAGERVALLDIDPQQSLARWHAARLTQGPRAGALAFGAPSGWRVPAELDRVRREADWIVLDTAPHAETEARVAIRAADLVLMPVQPAAADLWAATATVALAKAERRRLVAVLNRVPATGRSAAEATAELAAQAVQVLDARLGNRVQFATAFRDGLGVTEAAPRSAAAAEVLALLAALRALRAA